MTICVISVPPFLPIFAVMQLENCASGECVNGTGKQSGLVDAITGAFIATHHRRITRVRCCVRGISIT